MFKIFTGLWRFVLIAVIFLVVRSPILIGILGFTSGLVYGVMSYHLHPIETVANINLVLDFIAEHTGVCIDETLSFCEPPKKTSHNE